MPHQDRTNSHRPDFPPSPYGSAEPHDVLAAEEFGIGGRDERFPPDPLGVADPHDTLAAEEFIIGTRDDRWPRDPSGYYEPHDVLAAEAFPMPVPDARGAQPGDSSRTLLRLTVALAALGTAAVLLRRR